MAEDDDVPSHIRLGALKQLGELRRRQPPEGDDDPQAKMDAVVERHCPQTPEMAAVAADPMRDLDFEGLVGRPMDATALSWLPCLPASDRRAAERVERELVAAARRLGVGTGPRELPETADELAERRRRRAP
jgi:hypothetical protein